MTSPLVDEIVARVFPAGAGLISERLSLGAVAKERSAFWGVRASREMRWILPHASEDASEILRRAPPYRATSRIAWSLLLTAYRLDLLHRMPRVEPLLISWDGEDWSHLGWSSNQAPKVTLYVGTPGPLRKVIVFMGGGGRSREMVSKVPLGPGANDAILHEAAILRRLERNKPGMAPRLEFVDERAGVATSEALGGTRWGLRLDSGLVDWLRRLLLPGQRTSIRAQAALLRKRLEQLRHPSSTSNPMIARLLEKTERLTNGDPLPAAWVHGDFAPWNILKGANGQIHAVDWEWSEPEGLPGLDAIHFAARVVDLFHRGTLSSTAFEEKVLATLRRLALPGIADFTILRSVWRFYSVWYQAKMLAHRIDDDSLCRRLSAISTV
jgi:hypothetical protein